MPGSVIIRNKLRMRGDTRTFPECLGPNPQVGHLGESDCEECADGERAWDCVEKYLLVWVWGRGTGVPHLNIS
jgi:hypothetical protein